MWTLVFLHTCTALIAQQPQSSQQQLPPTLQPKISFSLDEGEQASADFAADQADMAEGFTAWRTLARKAAALEQLGCTDGLLDATARMVDEAERGDSLAMAALGVMCK